MKKDDIKKSLNEEKQYFNFRSGITKEVYTKVDEGFEKELQKLVHKIHSDQFEGNSAKVESDRNKLQDWYPEVLRESILVMFCSLMEEVLKDITKLCVPNNYEEEIKSENGSWLKRHLSVLKKSKGIDVNQDDVTFLQHFIDLRNCVVHAGGNINKSKYGDGIKEAVSKLQGYGRSHGSYMLNTYEDGYLDLNDHFMPEIFGKGRKIMNEIFRKLKEQ